MNNSVPPVISNFFCIIVRYVTSSTHLKFCFMQEDAGVLDSLLTSVSRRNLKKRIEKVENTISEVKSPLLGVASKSVPDDIANKNRCRIRTASNRMVQFFLWNITLRKRET